MLTQPSCLMPTFCFATSFVHPQCQMACVAVRAIREHLKVCPQLCALHACSQSLRARECTLPSEALPRLPRSEQSHEQLCLICLDPCLAGTMVAIATFGNGLRAHCPPKSTCRTTCAPVSEPIRPIHIPHAPSGKWLTSNKPD